MRFWVAFVLLGFLIPLTLGACADFCTTCYIGSTCNIANWDNSTVPGGHACFADCDTDFIDCVDPGATAKANDWTIGGCGADKVHIARITEDNLLEPVAGNVNIGVGGELYLTALISPSVAGTAIRVEGGYLYGDFNFGDRDLFVTNSGSVYYNSTGGFFLTGVDEQIISVEAGSSFVIDHTNSVDQIIWGGGTTVNVAGSMEVRSSVDLDLREATKINVESGGALTLSSDVVVAAGPEDSELEVQSPDGNLIFSPLVNGAPLSVTPQIRVLPDAQMTLENAVQFLANSLLLNGRAFVGKDARFTIPSVSIINGFPDSAVINLADPTAILEVTEAIPTEIFCAIKGSGTITFAGNVRTQRNGAFLSGSGPGDTQGLLVQAPTFRTSGENVLRIGIRISSATDVGIIRLEGNAAGDTETVVNLEIVLCIDPDYDLGDKENGSLTVFRRVVEWVSSTNQAVAANPTVVLGDEELCGPQSVAARGLCGGTKFGQAIGQGGDKTAYYDVTCNALWAQCSRSTDCTGTPGPCSAIRCTRGGLCEEVEFLICVGGLNGVTLAGGGVAATFVLFGLASMYRKYRINDNLSQEDPLEAAEKNKRRSKLSAASLDSPGMGDFSDLSLSAGKRASGISGISMVTSADSDDPSKPVSYATERGALLRQVLSSTPLLISVIDATPAASHEKLAKSFLRLSVVFSRSEELIAAILRAHLHETSDSNEVLRGNSFASTLVSSYLRLVCLPWLSSILTDAVDLITRSEVDGGGGAKKELNPSRVSRMSEANRMRVDLEDDAALVFEVLMDSKPPVALRRMMWIVAAQTSRRFPKKPAIVQRVLNTVLISKFIVPALTAPHTHQLADTAPDSNGLRTLVLVSKIITGVATGTPFGGKEAWMETVEPYRARMSPGFRKWVLGLADRSAIRGKPTDRWTGEVEKRCHQSSPTDAGVVLDDFVFPQSDAIRRNDRLNPKVRNQFRVALVKARGGAANSPTADNDAGASPPAAVEGRDRSGSGGSGGSGGRRGSRGRKGSSGRKRGGPRPGSANIGAPQSGPVKQGLVRKGGDSPPGQKRDSPNRGSPTRQSPTRQASPSRQVRIRTANGPTVPGAGTPREPGLPSPPPAGQARGRANSAGSRHRRKRSASRKVE